MAVHERKTLVQRRQCRIERCSCGVYHVSVGAVTLRVDEAQLTELFESIGVAIAPALGDEDDDSRVH